MPTCTCSVLLWRWSRSAEVYFGRNRSLFYRYIVNNVWRRSPCLQGTSFWGRCIRRVGTPIVIWLLCHDRLVEEATCWSHFPLLTVGSDLKVLIVISAASHSTGYCSSYRLEGHGQTEPAEPHHLEKAKTKLVPLNIQTAQRNYCMVVRILNRIGGKGQPWQTAALKANKYCNFVINGNIRTARIYFYLFFSSIFLFFFLFIFNLCPTKRMFVCWAVDALSGF